MSPLNCPIDEYRTKMPTYHVKCYETVNFTVAIEAESEEEALALYNRGHYPDSDYDMDDMFYDHEFNSIREETDENN